MAGEAIFKKIYSAIDIDGDGTISQTEVAAYFKALGLSSTDEEVRACIKLYDTDGDGTIDMDEFVSVTKKTCNALLNNESEAKDVLDKLFGKEGSVTEERLQSMFKVHGYHPSGQEVQDLLKQADADGNGDVTFEEFILKMAEIILKS